MGKLSLRLRLLLRELINRCTFPPIFFPICKAQQTNKNNATHYYLRVTLLFANKRNLVHICLGLRLLEINNKILFKIKKIEGTVNVVTLFESIFKFLTFFLFKNVP